ncbi:hypothetical protein TorRG33x02_290880 [Trema orientale]|uniref:Uncharacterized protein n=1 Tax=Trema orientale TaxID=63057 RepID=A0A2P5CBQ2_TREOI|nr:hypothetical protein TorRG33x02_290880 [Trema orientale]
MKKEQNLQMFVIQAVTPALSDVFFKPKSQRKSRRHLIGVMGSFYCFIFLMSSTINTIDNFWMSTNLALRRLIGVMGSFDCFIFLISSTINTIDNFWMSTNLALLSFFSFFSAALPKSLWL